MLYYTLFNKVMLHREGKGVLELTQPQKRVLVLLKRRWRERGSQPNLNEVALELGMHYVSLRQHLEALDKKGYLSFQSQGRGKPPVIRFSGGAEGVPLLGDIAAGGLQGAVEHLEGFLAVPSGPTSAIHTDRFALRVKGDSMSERIEDGDVVILRPPPFRSGDICAVRHEDETTLKYLDLYSDDRALLRPHNPSYAPIEVDRENIYVAGVFEALLRGSIIGSLFREADVR